MASPERNVQSDFSLAAVVQAALTGNDPDPHAIAADVAESLSLADVREALRTVLPYFVRKEMSRRQFSTAPALRPGSARWDNVAELHAAGELTLLRARVFAHGAWKFLGDCTSEDVQDIAAQRQDAAARNIAAAERFEALRVAMGRRRATTVRDLPETVLTAIFDA
jgi:hypothetical protein